MKKITFFGRVFVRNGKPVIEMDNREDAAQMVLEAMGGPTTIRIVFYEDEKEREKWVNAYYWRVVVPAITGGVNDLGNEWSNTDTHNYLKGQYTPNNTTKTLTTNQFRTYIEKCCKFAAEILGVAVPLPSADNDRFAGLQEPPR